jgi:hypothetical protein
MGFRKALRPGLELLESKTVMSAGVVAGAGAAALSLDTPAGAKLARPAEQTVSLTGSANGDYTSTLSKHSLGIKYDLSASGTITPIGSAVVNGWFHAPGSNGGQDSGSLTIVSSRGTLKLKDWVRPRWPLLPAECRCHSRERVSIDGLPIERIATPGQVPIYSEKPDAKHSARLADRVTEVKELQSSRGKW